MINQVQELITYKNQNILNIRNNPSLKKDRAFNYLFYCRICGEPVAKRIVLEENIETLYVSLASLCENHLEKISSSLGGIILPFEENEGFSQASTEMLAIHFLSLTRNVK